MRRVRTDADPHAAKPASVQLECRYDALGFHRKSKKWETQTDAVDRIIGDSNEVERIVGCATAICTAVPTALILLNDRNHVGSSRLI